MISKTKLPGKTGSFVIHLILWYKLIDMEYTYIVIHYAEIGLKGQNRPFFEKRLEKNIKKSFERDEITFKSIERKYGRILVKLSENPKLGRIDKTLSNVFGIANFSFAVKVKSKIEEIENKAVEILKVENFQTFKIDTRRSDKKFPMKSMEVNEKVGQKVVDNLKKNVDLENPDKTVFIEITWDGAFIYLEKIDSLGGLPVGTGNKTLVLLSGGIDSPVAAYLLNKRGVENIFIHFYSCLHTGQASINKAKKIVEILNEYQFKSKLYLVPFIEIQREILDQSPPSLRILLYRRFMFRIAEKLAEKQEACVLTTGESVGQVASQTLENIKAISESIKTPILRPLIGFNKEEIISLSKKIGTYETSILPCQDSCTQFMPDHPETKATIKQIKKAEENLDLDKLIEMGVQSIEEVTVQQRVN